MTQPRELCSSASTELQLSHINMAQSNRSSQKPLLTQEQLKKKLEISNFDPNAILRGAQLTVVGGQIPCWLSRNYFTDNVVSYIALRALQNPALFTSEHYKQAAVAVAAGIAIRLAISIPVRAYEAPLLGIAH